MVCLYTNRQIESKERREAEARETEARKKHEDQERAAREERSRLELQKKQAKEKKEAERQWNLENLLAKQKENLREEFEIIFEKKLKKALVAQKALQGKARTESGSDEEEDMMEELLEKRKRRPVPTCQVDALGESPLKVGRASPSRAAAEERSPRLAVPQRLGGTDSTRLGFPYQDSGLWESAPTADDFVKTRAFRKVIHKFLSKKTKLTIDEMCKEGGVVYRGRLEAVDELVELRMMYFSAQPASPAAPRPRQRSGGIVIREVAQPEEPQHASRDSPTKGGDPEVVEP
ncbi:hypothetical protein CBR_g3324 [Chara braunii]|uniref:Uncharacterized protein n=1 Tax=Chara braunii TaxID=69332 RepID=A0A388KFE5_CHABU|nr:hypothetical protein CBR_g3324 [Chara braunii]|eukprot:GBG68784.1 hypothetical protein CBR_g3324 [Chara braunii]